MFSFNIKYVVIFKGNLTSINQYLTNRIILQRESNFDFMKNFKIHEIGELINSLTLLILKNKIIILLINI